MIKIALTKGRIEKKAVELLARCGFDVSPLLDKGREQKKMRKSWVQFQRLGRKG